jgi:hypothetical protein
MTEHQRSRRRLQIMRRARALELSPFDPDPDLRRELEVFVADDKHAASGQWFASPGLTVYGMGAARRYGRPFWRGRW